MVVLYLIFLIQGQENIEANAKEEEGKLGEEKATSRKHHQEMYIVCGRIREDCACACMRIKVKFTNLSMNLRSSADPCLSKHKQVPA